MTALVVAVYAIGFVVAARVLTFDVNGQLAHKLHDIAPGRVPTWDFLLCLSALLKPCG